MEYSKSLPSPDAPGFPGSFKPMRKRLQKFTPKTKIFGVKRNSNDSAISTSDAPQLYAQPREMSTFGSTTLNHNPFANEPVIPMPPDLSDSKWLDYIERSGLMIRETTPTVEKSVPKPMRKRPPPIIPELSHLSRSARPSLDSTSSDSWPGSASTTSTMRRQAKTPVFRIGQLESKSFGRDPWIAAKTSSVELIAEQYRALLEHRDAMEEEEQAYHSDEDDMDDFVSSIYTASSVCTAHQSEPALVQPHNPIEVKRKKLPRHSSEDTPINIMLEPVRASTLLAQHSPASSNGTYVGRDDEAFYFKPVSFSHCPPTPATEDVIVNSRTHTDESADSLSFQICLDLLTKELSRAFADRSSRVGSDASALQIWVMIEAYERLQNQVASMDLSQKEKANMDAMFRSWLEPLYKVHAMMSGKPKVDEKDYEGLAEAVD